MGWSIVARTGSPRRAEAAQSGISPGEPGAKPPYTSHMTAKTHRLGLTTSEAARHLGVSLSTIRRWSDLGLPAGLPDAGGQRRFSPEQLDEFIGLAAVRRAVAPGPRARDARRSDLRPRSAFRDDEARFRAHRPAAPDAEPEPEPGDER